MSERNNKDKFSDNRKDLFIDFNKDNSDIDELLEDAFSFMDSHEEEEEVIVENGYSDDIYVEEISEDEVEEDRTDKKTRRRDLKKSAKVQRADEEEELPVKDSTAKKVLYSLLIAILSICIVLVLGVLISFKGAMNSIYDEGGALPTQPGQTLAPEENFETMYDVSDAASLNDFLKKWATNDGEIMDSDNIINILLIGQDGDGGEKSNGRSDSLIIASVNKSTKTITLASIMRDSYIYMNVDGRDRYEKINASCAYGGPKGVIDTIEKNFKIDIDYYASVYFESFKNVVDALGGVSVPIEPGLASYINRTTRYNVSSGDAVLLGGGEALAYSRIRYYYTDSDVSRTANQRRVIMGIMNKVKGASVTELYNVIKSVLPYMKTNMKQSVVLSYGKQAITEGWINYAMKQETFPTLETRATATIGGASCWAVDYPLAAQQLQKLLYGKTNISLDPNRINILTSYLKQKPSTNSGGYTPGIENTTIDTSGETFITEDFTGETTTDINGVTSVDETTTKGGWGSNWGGLWGENNSTTVPATQPPATEPITNPPETPDAGTTPAE